LRNRVESVLDRDNECSDFSEDETESEVSSVGNDDESSDKDSDRKNDDAPGPCKHVRTMTQKKNRVTESVPKLTTILLPTPLPQKVEFVMAYCQNLKQNHHLNSLFCRICGTFV
jgi:hypothetical protein